MFEPATKRWEIRGKDGGVFGHTPEGLKTFPLGEREWSLSEKEPRHLQLFPDVGRPGMFCCNSGLCIDSQQVCDGKPDCDDSSDQADCEMIRLPETFSYNSGKPPARVLRKKNITVVRPLDVELNLTILEVLDVREVNLEIEISFLLELTWYDHRLHFNYLKENPEKNQVDVKKVWTPKLLFYIENEDKSENYEDKLTVLRKSTTPVLVPRGQDPIEYFYEKPGKNNSEINFDEVYAGGMNPLQLTTEKRKVFVCSFSNMNNYPFGDQWCSFTLLIERSNNEETNLMLNQLQYKVSKIGRYTVRQWQWEQERLERGDKLKAVKVSVLLDRKIDKIFLVSYLPTILMNIINQAANYIRSENKYDLIYTVNITCMMVLASVYLSVSESLPVSFNTKPIEQWLLFNLFWPFLIIISNILLQVYNITTLSETEGPIIFHRSV